LYMSLKTLSVIFYHFVTQSPALSSTIALFTVNPLNHGYMSQYYHQSSEFLKVISSNRKTMPFESPLSALSLSYIVYKGQEH
jgi:hypothetical protein